LKSRRVERARVRAAAVVQGCLEPVGLRREVLAGALELASPGARRPDLRLHPVVEAAPVRRRLGGAALAPLALLLRHDGAADAAVAAVAAGAGDVVGVLAAVLGPTARAFVWGWRGDRPNLDLRPDGP
jgi:hypothetical protein